MIQEDIYVARAPGRLDVIGGIADYSGSLVLQVSTLLFLAAVALFFFPLFNKDIFILFGLFFIKIKYFTDAY